MTLLKVLCVALFLYSPSFSEGGRLENHSILKKRAQASNTQTSSSEKPAHIAERDQAVRNAAQLVAAVRAVTGKETGQFGYVYLQPTETNAVDLIPKSVAVALYGEDDSLTPYTTPWPTGNFNTNFRFCFVNYKEPAETNYGHPEHQLLEDNGLGKMVENMGCPKYVILYSTNLPCYTPQNPDPKIPRCAELTLLVKDAFVETCPKATFYLYTDKETGANLPDERKMDFLMNSGIVWLHPDMLNVNTIMKP